MIFARLDKREKRLNAHKTGKRKKRQERKIGQTCNRNVERWEKHFEAATTVAPREKIHDSVKKFQEHYSKGAVARGEEGQYGENRSGEGDCD